MERFSYNMKKCLREVFVTCFISQWMKRSKHGLFVFPPKKTLIWRRHCSISWPIVLQYDVKAISRMGMKFFHLSVRWTNQSQARLYPFDKPIKLLYFCLFDVSVLFASFHHFKVIRESLYKFGNSRLKTLKTVPCSVVHTRLGQINPPPPPPWMKILLTGPVVFEAFRHIVET